MELGGRVRERERESSFTWGDSRAGHVLTPCDAASRFDGAVSDGVERVCVEYDFSVSGDFKEG